MIHSLNHLARSYQTYMSNLPGTAKKTDFAATLQQVTDESGLTGSLDQIFTQASQRYDVSTTLLKAVAKAESNFNPQAVSPCGAQGIMQLMPQTAEYLGVNDAFDPLQNILGGAKYLSQMLQLYDGDVKLTLAAYNAGSGNVAKYGGIPPFQETQNYVVKVLNYMDEDLPVPTLETLETAAPSFPTDDIYAYDDYLTFLNRWQGQWELLLLIKQLTDTPSILDPKSSI